MDKNVDNQDVDAALQRGKDLTESLHNDTERGKVTVRVQMERYGIPQTVVTYEAYADDGPEMRALSALVTTELNRIHGGSTE